MARALMKMSRTLTPLGQLAAQEPQSRQRDEMVLDPAGVFQDFLQQAVQQGELAPGHVRLPAGFGKQRAERLAEAAAHADHQLVFQIFH